MASQWLVDGILVSVYGQPINNLIINSFEASGPMTKAWLAAGTRGAGYRLTNRITTSMGRVEERSMLVRCEDK